MDTRVETEAGEPLLWSRGVRKALGWLLVVTCVLPPLVLGSKLILDVFL